MEIRKANINDIDRILDLLRQVLNAHRELRPDIFIPNRTKYTREALMEMIEQGHNIFVAVIDDYVVGHLFYEIQEPQSISVIMPHRILYIDDLVVDENYRHQGIGRALFEFAKAGAKSMGCYEITLTAWKGNDLAKKFYESLGMGVKNTTMEYIIGKK